MSDQRFKEQLSEVLGDSAGLLSLLQELSQTVPVDGVFYLLINALEDLTGLTESQNEELSVSIARIQEIISKFTRSDEKERHIEEMRSLVIVINDSIILGKLLDIAYAEFSVDSEENLRLINIMRDHYYQIVN